MTAWLIRNTHEYESARGMRYFPSFFDVSDRLAVIAGGGETAARKARLLAKAGARFKFVAPEFDDDLRRSSRTRFIARASLRLQTSTTPCL